MLKRWCWGGKGVKGEFNSKSGNVRGDGVIKFQPDLNSRTATCPI